ncbi:MAG: alpha/beta hydrolase [Proteobacteria bacterium]|nr:alpha/beta hydrolase [Pseudomonadota bacterium]
MFVITNRNLTNSRKPEKKFGGKFNPDGPEIIRLAEATKKNGKWRINIMKEPENMDETGCPSESMFLKLQKKMRTKNRNCLFFIHGYNNTFEDSIEMGHSLEKKYDVEVVVFSWPSDGKALKYKKDKRDAILSVAALDRAFERLKEYLTKHQKTACNQSFNLMVHSMGNYLFKHLMKSSVYERETLLFNNILLVQADTNNKNHAEWVDRIAFRHNLYICINENDSALSLSRAKVGDAQLVRLGHFLHNLNSKNAKYVDFTDAKGVDSSHSYFKETARNKSILKFFSRAFNGKRAEIGIPYDYRKGAFSV